MSASEPDRAMTAYHLFETKLDDPEIPGPPLLPTDISPPPTKPPPTELEQIKEQLASVHGALYSSDGLLHGLFANLMQLAKDHDRLAASRHEEMMRTLTTLANGQVDLSDRLAKIEPKVEEHDAELRLVSLHGEHVAATGAE